MTLPARTARAEPTASGGVVVVFEVEEQVVDGDVDAQRADIGIAVHQAEKAAANHCRRPVRGAGVEAREHGRNMWMHRGNYTTRAENDDILNP